MVAWLEIEHPDAAEHLDATPDDLSAVTTMDITRAAGGFACLDSA
nr:hypothetical protein [Actinomadura madurae]